MRNNKREDSFKRSFNQPIVDTELMRFQVMSEINSNKVNIDRSVFTKTEQEKIDLANAKSEWKRYMKNQV